MTLNQCNSLLHVKPRLPKVWGCLCSNLYSSGLIITETKLIGVGGQQINSCFLQIKDWFLLVPDQLKLDFESFLLLSCPHSYKSRRRGCYSLIITMDCKGCPEKLYSLLSPHYMHGFLSKICPWVSRFIVCFHLQIKTRLSLIESQPKKVVVWLLLLLLFLLLLLSLVTKT